MDKLWIVVSIIALYLALQLWILPAFGVPTWMSGKCPPGEGEEKKGRVTEKEE